ncbi:hypothetical protein JRQ81_004937 [Phrynocephalus forsythii]|uniref:Leucine-rich PPR motif-containing protein, mitochondrial n=1 Tax=Phrynocephalus forsythii TaxID=171643 RepID=A0A9Q0Y528_9SAUR|nr:hypothetical protein JRQ81_004937 [Phrynocephalus forsythii]
MKEKDVPFYNGIATSFFHILNGAALQGKLETVTRLHEAILSQDLLKNNVQLCNPLITVHLAKDDIPAALEALLNCYKKYGILPRLHDVLCKLIEKEHTELLQKAVDFINQERGQMTMLYELFFAFMSTGKYKEAKKIIELYPATMESEASKSIPTAPEPISKSSKYSKSKHNLDSTDAPIPKKPKKNKDKSKSTPSHSSPTPKLCSVVSTRSDQSVNLSPNWRSPSPPVSIYSSDSGSMDPRLARAEDLLSFFSSVPLVYETHCWDGPPARSAASTTSHQPAPLKGHLPPFAPAKTCANLEPLAQKHKHRQKRSTDIKGFVLNDAASSFLIITQVRRDYLKDALSTLKTIIENGGLPSELSVTRLVQALAQKGDLESIRAVEKMVENLHEAIKLSSMLFVSNTTLAHINNNNTDAAVEYLESLLISGKLNSQTANITYVYRKLIENKLETPLEKLDAMAERLANQFGIYRPVTDLFLQYINGERMEDARRLLEVIIHQEKCTSVCELKRPNVHKIKALLDLVPDLDKSLVSFYLLKCYEYNRDLASAKALYEKLKEENVQPEDLFLKSYATFLKKMGETVPFTEPPNTFKFYADQLRSKQHEDYSSDED